MPPHYFITLPQLALTLRIRSALHALLGLQPATGLVDRSTQSTHHIGVTMPLRHFFETSHPRHGFALSLHRLHLGFSQ